MALTDIIVSTLSLWARALFLATRFLLAALPPTHPCPPVLDSLSLPPGLRTQADSGLRTYAAPQPMWRQLYWTRSHLVHKPWSINCVLSLDYADMGCRGCDCSDLRTRLHSQELSHTPTAQGV